MESNSGGADIENKPAEEINSEDKLDKSTDSLKEGKNADDQSLKIKTGTVNKGTRSKLSEQEILVPLLSSNLQTNALAIITAAVVANEDTLEDNSAQVVLSIYCGIYNIYLGFVDIPEVCRYVTKAGYKVNEVTLEEWTTWVALKRKGTSHIVAHYLYEDEAGLIKLAWALMGPLLCLLGHKPNSSNIEYWGNSMLGIFKAATSLGRGKSHLLFYPSLKFCQSVTKLLDKMCGVKRHLFYVVYNSASSVPRLASCVCRMVVENLRGTGLLNFTLIDQYLLIEHPFALLLINLAKHSTVLLSAYDQYMKFGHLAPWCTIIGTPEELQIFNDPSLKFVAAVARGFAIHKGVTALQLHDNEENEEVRNALEKTILLWEEIKSHHKNRMKKSADQ